jgi:hypothetical protein
MGGYISQFNLDGIALRVEQELLFLAIPLESVGGTP